MRLAGRLPKWPTGADCKSAGLRLRWFESITYHHLLETPALTETFQKAEDQKFNFVSSPLYGEIMQA
jgi:hypothetical protein